MNDQELKAFLDEQVARFNQSNFIPSDPISIPHQFNQLQDIEIMGFWTAMLAWGQRKTIINKAQELIQLMDGAPYQFITQHQEKDRKAFLNFKHRTFQATDTLYFLTFLQEHYKKYHTLEKAFCLAHKTDAPHVESALIGFHEYFFSLPNAPSRTRKHIATPARKSTCKRLNMFLRWMVRKDDRGVDFGLWKEIKSSQLLIPLDVHVERVGRRLGLIERKQKDWRTVLELSQKLKRLNPEDPVRYDYALFGLGVVEKNGGLISP